MTKKYLVLSIITGFILSGCSSKYPVTFDSNPRGATIICNGKNWGYSPKTLYYDEVVKENSTLNLGSCSANWISGARRQYGIIDLTQFPNGVIQTLQRPNVDGYDKDAQFALQVEIMNAQQRQAAAAESAAYQAQMQNYEQQRLDRERNNQLQQMNYNLNGIRYGY